MCFTESKALKHWLCWREQSPEVDSCQCYKRMNLLESRGDALDDASCELREQSKYRLDGASWDCILALELECKEVCREAKKCDRSSSRLVRIGIRHSVCPCDVHHFHSMKVRHQTKKKKSKLELLSMNLLLERPYLLVLDPHWLKLVSNEDVWCLDRLNHRFLRVRDFQLE